MTQLRTSPRLSVRTTVVSAALSAWVYRGLNLLTGLVVLPLTAAHLGKIELGIWVLVGNLLSFVSLSDLGIGSGISRFVARFRGDPRPQQLSVFLSTATVLLGLIALAMIALTLVVAPYVPRFLGAPAELAADARFAFGISGCAAALLLVFRAAAGILAGYQKYGPHSVGKILETLFSFGAVLACAKLENLNLRTLAWTSAAAAILANVGLLWVAFKMTGPWRINPRLFNQAMARELLTVGASALGMSLSSTLYSQGIGLLVGIFYGLPAAAVYGVCMILAINIQALLSSLGVAFTTIASELQGKNELTRIVAPTRLVGVATSALAACALAGIAVYGPAILSLMFSRSDWQAADFNSAHVLLIIMAAGLTIGTPYTATKSSMMGVGAHWKVFGWVLAAALAAVGGALLFAVAGLPFWTVGIAWTLFWVIPATTILPTVQARQAGVSISRLAWQIHSPAFFIGTILTFVSFVLSQWWAPDTVAILVVQILIGVVVGGVCTTLWIRQTHQQSNKSAA